jgi:hypothetical protein
MPSIRSNSGGTDAHDHPRAAGAGSRSCANAGGIVR